MIEFEFDPDFRDNIMKASYKSKSSLRPLFDQVRNVTDNIYIAAREMIAREAGRAEGEVQAIRDKRFSKTGKAIFDEKRAKAFALKSARNTMIPTMEYDGKEIHGRVSINRSNSVSIEFGGVDSTVEIGKGTGEYVSHPAYAFLRRAMDRSGG